MSAYVCIENNAVISITAYQPEVPGTVLVLEISDSDYALIQRKTHFYNVLTGKVEPIPVHVEDYTAAANLRFLTETDWMVLRHMRETALGLATSLTADEYLMLEQKRQLAAKSI